MRILIVDDEALVLDFMSRLLQKKCFVVKKAKTIKEARQALLDGDFDLIILDRNFVNEGQDGLNLCQEIRERDQSTPIMILSAVQGSRERSLGLQCGADDYLEKPYDPVELVARVEALIRRRNKKIVPDKIGAFVLDKEKYQVFVEGDLLQLKLKEFQLLYHFLNNAGRVITESELLEKVWNDDVLATKSNTINVHIMRLRKQLGKYASCLRTVRGHGFIFEIKQ